MLSSSDDKRRVRPNTSLGKGLRQKSRRFLFGDDVFISYSRREEQRKTAP